MNSTKKTLIDIIKTSIFGGRCTGILLSEKNWKKVYTMAKRGGVAALCYETLSRSEGGNKPNQQLMIRWAARYNDCLERYNKRVKSFNSLSEVLRDNNIEALVFKGFVTSRHYPQPQFREFGDIDIFAFGDFEENENYFRKSGFGITHPSRRHSIFRVNGITVELHRHILHNRSFVEKDLDTWLQNEGKNNPVDASGFHFLPPLAEAIHYILHASQHFSGNDCNAKVRTIVDWAMILKDGGWNYADLQNRLADPHLCRFADVLTLTVNNWFGSVQPEVLNLVQYKSKRVCNLFEKAVFDKKYQRNDEKKRLKRMFGHLRKSIVYCPLKKIKFK